MSDPKCDRCPIDSTCSVANKERYYPVSEYECPLIYLIKKITDRGFPLDILEPPE